MSDLPDIVKELRAAEEKGELSTSSILRTKTTTLVPIHQNQEDAEKKQSSEFISTYFSKFQTNEIQNLFPTDLYKQVIKLSPDGIVTVDIAGIITSCNPAAEKMLGYSSGEIIGKHFTKTNIFHTKDIPHLLWLFTNILSGKTQGPFELQYYRKDGSAFWAEVRVTLLKKEHRTIGILAISRDISTQRSSEKKIQTSEQRYRDLYEGSRDGFVLVNIDGKIIESNTTFQKLVGYTADELTKKTHKEITPRKWHDIEAHILKEQVFNHGYSEVYNKEYIRKDGKIIPIEIRTHLLKEEGKTTGMWAFVRDISERKQKEQELQEITNHFESLFNSMVDPVVIADTHGTILEISESVVQQTGFTREDLVGKNFLRTKLVTTRSKALLLANLAKRMTGVHISPYQIEVISKDGKLLPYEINAAKIAYKGKTADMVVFRDVSERYRVENALRESEEKFRMISEQSLMGIAIIQDNHIKYINEAAAQITGYSKDEFKQNGVTLITKLIHPDDLSFVMDQLKKKLNRELDVIPHYSYKIVTKSGDIRWIDQFSKTISYTGKNADFITIIDVTDKKNAETQLRKSEEKYRNIVELAPNGIAILNTKGLIQSCNTALLKSIGLSKKDIIGKSFTKLPIFSNTEQPKYLKIFKNILKGDIPKPFETNWKNAAGRNYYGEIHVSLMKEDDKLKAIQVIVLDITERKTTTEKEKKYLENVQFLSKSAMEFAQSSDKQDLFEVFCQRLKELVPHARIIVFNYNNKEQTFSIRSLEGFDKYLDTILSALHEDVNEIIIPIEEGDWRKQLRTGKLTKIPKEKFYKMASKRIHSDAYQQLQKIINPNEVYTMGFIRENQLHGAIIIIASKKRNIDNQSIIETFVNQAATALQRRIAEDQIKQQNTQLRKMDKLKSEFLNITSHELRTPMTAMKGYLHMLNTELLGPLTNEQEHAIQVIHRNTNRLDHLVQDILDTSRLESGTMKFIPTETKIPDLIVEIVDTMQSSANTKNINIQTKIPKALPTLTIDQERIKQVFDNIINNAIKFSPENSMIEIRAHKKSDVIEFEIQDYGKGIPKDKQQKIFETFYQVDSGIDRTFGGTGLGLTISRGIIMGHGGTIWVDSELGKGSTFKFTLPIIPIKDVEGTFKKVDIFSIKKTAGEFGSED